MAVNPAQLAFQTQQAYSRGTEIDIQPILDGAKEWRDFQRAEYKSLQDVGSELDANFYGKWESNLNSLYDKAASGELKVGSPEWSAATKKLKDRAAQIKQVQDLRDEQIKLFQTKPDQTQFLEETETGELIDTGSAGYRERIEELLQNNYDDPTQLANDFAKLSRRVQVMPVGISTGFKEARTSTEKVGETLLNAGETEVQNQQVRAGNITFDVKTTMNPQDTDRMVKGLVSQYEPVLRADYKRKSAVQDLGLTEDEYVKTTIESMLPSGKVENKVRSVPRPRNDDDSGSGLRDLGNGRFKSNDYMFEVINDATDRERSSIRGRRKGVGGRMTVTYTGKGETIKSFVDEDGDDILGKLTSIYVSNDGVITMNVLSGSNEENTVPFEKNAAKIEEFYGITKEQILSAIDGGDIKKAGTVIGGKSTESGVGAKNNKEEITW